MSASTRKLAIRGSLWTLGAYGASQVVRLGSNVVLAWLLFPEVFGLMALVKVVLVGLYMFTDVGIGPCIIRSPRGGSAEFLGTAWTIQVIRGLALWVCVCILSYPAAWLFSRNDPLAWELLFLLPVAGLVAVIGGFYSTALHTLNRDLRLGRITMLELSSQLVSVVVMIGWALLDASVWALVAGRLAGVLYKMFASHRIVPEHRVRFRWDGDCARELVGFGKWIFLSTAFTFAALNLDKLVLGNLLSLAELGLYSIALVFSNAALKVTSRLGHSVLFPIYSRLQDDPERLMSVALRAREIVLWAGGAVCIAFAIGAPLFFHLSYDDRYFDAGSIAQWLAVYTWAMITLQTFDRIPLALGNSRVLFTANVLRCVGIGVAALGYFIGGLPAFVCGLATGPLVAHVYVLRGVPSGRKEVVVQTVRMTCVVIAYGAPAVALTTWLRGISAGAWMTSVILLAALPLVAAGLAAVRRLRESSKTQSPHVREPEVPVCPS